MIRFYFSIQPKDAQYSSTVNEQAVWLHICNFYLTPESFLPSLSLGHMPKARMELGKDKHSISCSLSETLEYTW